MKKNIIDGGADSKNRAPQEDSARNPYLFFAKALLMLALVTGFLFGIVMPQYTQGFNASLLDKVARLQSIQGPKIVLLGNSNLAFGVNSEAIEAAMGMPVVNMGLHGGVGNAFNEAAAKLHVVPGDVYVVCHTEYDDNDEILDPSLVWITLENHFPLWRLLRAKDIPLMKDAFSTYVKKSLDLWLSGEGNAPSDDMYARGYFNVYGDNIYERPYAPGTVKIDFETQEAPAVGDACVARLNALNKYLTERGASLVVAAFPIANGEFTPLMSEYEDFQTELEEKLDCPVISYFPEYMMEYSYFYDTIHHLTDDGVAYRTDLLIADLELWMENGDAEAEEGE